MSEINERVAVLETQVINLDEKIDDLKCEVRANHQDIQDHLEQMAANSTVQHGQLAEKITRLEKTNHGWHMWLLGAAAVISALSTILNWLK